MGTVNQEKHLERIADALEAINSTLDSMDQSLDLLSSVIADCQVKTGMSSALGITGMIEQI